MRIAYVTLHWPRTKSSSIGRKITRQMKEWRSSGHEVAFFSHLHVVENEGGLIEGTRYFYPSNRGLIARELGRISAAKNLLRGISEYSPDLIYLRWGMYTVPIRQIFKIAPTVVEINTNDKKEHKLLGKILYLYNYATRSILLENANGLIFTSNELVSDSAFRKYVDEYEVIANGIDIKAIPFYKAPNNTPPRLVFLGTPGMAWHGLEKLIPFAKSFPDIHIDIVGSESSVIDVKPPKNITFHGFLQGKKFEGVLSKADATIGSISLHLNEMEEASPFKVRDCAGRGIPCVLPYTDTDLTGLDSEEILQIPNTTDNLETHGEQVHNFILAMRGKRLKRNLIQSKIDIAQKEQVRIAFFEHILCVRKP